jgi:hypothetical protein
MTETTPVAPPPAKRKSFERRTLAQRLKSSAAGLFASRGDLSGGRIAQLALILGLAMPASPASWSNWAFPASPRRR